MIGIVVGIALAAVRIVETLVVIKLIGEIPAKFTRYSVSGMT